MPKRANVQKALFSAVNCRIFHKPTYCSQEGKEEPTASIAASIGLEETSLEDDKLDKFNIKIQVFNVILMRLNDCSLTFEIFLASLGIV